MAPFFLVGLGGFEPPTSPLSGVRSNQLSYRPVSVFETGTSCLSLFKQFVWVLTQQINVSLKEVIQPQVPLRLPCYDFTPVMKHTVVSALRS